MSFEAMLAVLASLITICGGVASAILFVRDPNRKDKRAVILGVVSVLAALLAISLLLNRANGPVTGFSQGTTPQPTSTQLPPATPAPSPTSTPIAQVAPNTILCSSDSANFWQSWNPSGSWHLLNGDMLNDGTAANGYYDLLLAPAVCQPPNGNPDYEVTMKVKAITCGGGDFSGFGAWLRSTSGNGSMGGYLFYTCAAFDRAVIAQGDFNGLGSLDEVGTGTAIRTYTMKVQGNVETFLQDGVTLVQVTDNTALSAGEIALFCSYGDQIDISSFSVTTL